VLALEPCDRRQPLLDLLQAPGLGLEALAVAAQLAQQILALEQQHARPPGELGERRIDVTAAVEAAARREQRRQRPGLLSVQRLLGGGGGMAQAFEVAQPVAFEHQRIALLRLRVERLDLAELKLEQVELALARARQLAEPRELAASLADRSPGRGAGRATRRLLDAAGAVEDVELCRGEHQLAVLVLAVERQQFAGQLAQLANRDRAPADVGAGATVAADAACQHQFTGVRRKVLAVQAVGKLEDPFDVGLSAAGADDSGLGAAAEQQIEGVREHRLARPGLAGQDVEPGRQLESRVLDQQQVLNRQL
jgi:hypothetical protein